MIAVDRCPLYFNDGEDPWTVDENYIRVFDFDNLRTKDSGAGTPGAVLSLFVLSVLASRV